MTRIERAMYAAKVRARLRRRSRALHLTHISEATGVSKKWLESFSAGYFQCPSIERVQLTESFLNSYEAAQAS